MLIAGIFVLLSPSFTSGAQAYLDNAIDKKNIKTYGKDVTVKYVNCKNINVNVNGFELSLNSIPRLVGNELAAEAEAETGVNSFGSGIGINNGPSGIDNTGIVFVCINNNNNAGQGGEDDNGIDQTCETCFTTIVPEEDLNGIIADFEMEEIDSLQDICNFIDENVQTAEGRLLITNILGESFGNAEVDFNLLVQVLECLEEAYDVDFPEIMV